MTRWRDGGIEHWWVKLQCLECVLPIVLEVARPRDDDLRNAVLQDLIRNIVDS